MTNWKHSIDEFRKEMTIREAMKEDISEYAENPSQYCMYCNCPKTLIPKSDISKIFKKEYVQNTLKDIKEWYQNKNTKEKFNVNDLLKYQNALLLSCGGLQRKALFILVLMGELKMEVENIKIGERSRPKYWFLLNEGDRPKCIINFNGALAHSSSNYRKKNYWGVHSENEASR